MPQEAQITDPDAMEAFLLAGRARATLVSTSTTRRFTYRVQMPRIKPRQEGESEAEYGARKEKAHKKRARGGVRFVSVLTGADNTQDYSYIGHIDENGGFRLDRRSRFAATAPSVVAWSWFWETLRKRRPALGLCEVWHDGRCARCGRTLTVPSSVASGLGPVCAGK